MGRQWCLVCEIYTASPPAMELCPETCFMREQILPLTLLLAWGEIGEMTQKKPNGDTLLELPWDEGQLRCFGAIWLSRCNPHEWNVNLRGSLHSLFRTVVSALQSNFMPAGLFKFLYKYTSSNVKCTQWNLVAHKILGGLPNNLYGVIPKLVQLHVLHKRGHSVQKAFSWY